MSDTVIERTFEVRGAGEASTSWTITLRLEKPVPADQAFECAYEISYSGRSRRVPICGEDSLQALLLALGVAANDLDTIVKKRGGTVESDVWGTLMRHKLVP